MKEGNAFFIYFNIEFLSFTVVILLSTVVDLLEMPNIKITILHNRFYFCLKCFIDKIEIRIRNVVF